MDEARLELGATGTVTTVLHIPLPVEVTAFEPGWPATPSRAVCRLALGRLTSLAADS